MVGGELTHPLLDDEDGEEQAHEVYTCMGSCFKCVRSLGGNGASLGAGQLDFDEDGVKQPWLSSNRAKGWGFGTSSTQRW